MSTIKMSELVKMLKESNGDVLIKVKIPSCGKVIHLKSMTIGHRKSMIKYATLGNNDIEKLLNFQLAKLGLIKTLAIEEINENTDITEVDLIYLMAIIRMNNILDDLTLDNIKCTNCKKVFKHTIDFNKICENCEKFEFINEKIELVDKMNNKWVFEVGYPSVYNIIVLEKFAYENNLSDEVKALNTLFLYIKNITVNNNIIEDYNDYDILNKIEFFDNLPEYIPIFGKNGLLNILSEKFNVKKIYDIYGPVECPYCNNKMEGVLTSDSFFIL